MKIYELMQKIGRITSEYGIRESETGDFVLSCGLKALSIKNDKYADVYNELMERGIVKKVFFTSYKEASEVFINFLMDLDDYSLIYEAYLKISYAFDPFDSQSSDSLCELTKKLLDIKDSDRIMDCCANDGSFTFNCFKDYPNNKYSLIEYNFEKTQLLKIMELLSNKQMDIKQLNSLLNEEDRKFDYYFDKCFLVPPFGYRGPKLLQSYARCFNDCIKPSTSTEWIFVEKMLRDMNMNGKMAVLLPEGRLYAFADKSYREFLLRNGFIEGIIKLPRYTLRNTGLLVSLLIISHDNKKVRLLDASEMFTQTGNRTNNMIELNVDSILNEYYSDNCKTYDIDELLKKDTLSVDKILIGQKEIKYARPIEEICEDIIQATQSTFKNFESYIANEETDYQLLSASDIENGFIKWDELKYVNPVSKVYDKNIIQKNDVIITSKSLKVKIAVVEEEIKNKIIAIGGLLIIRPNLNECNPYYLKMYLESKTGQEILKSVQVGNTITNISKNALAKLTISMPKKEIQDKFVKKYLYKTIEYNTLAKELADMKEKLENYYEDEVEVKI